MLKAKCSSSITPKKDKFGSLHLVVIQATTFCNLNCDYCYLPDRLSKHQFSLELLQPIFKNIFESSLVRNDFTIVWHAGEPLTVPIAFYDSAIQTIDELNQTLNSNKCKIFHGIQTNGTLITQAWCDLIQKYSIKTGVSLDGPDFIHDAHRKTKKGLGSHAATMRGISLLQRNNIHFHAIAVLTQDSLNYPDEIFQFFMEHKIRNIGFNIEEIEGANNSSSLVEITELENRYRFFMERLYELSKNTNGYLKVREFEQSKRFICGDCDPAEGQFIPFTMINIDYEGNFSTFSPELLSMKSSTYNDFILGNFRSDTLASVRQNEKFVRMYRDIQAGVELCKQTCQYFAVCGGGAPSNKYFENGTFASSETMYCRLTKQIVTDIVLEDIEKSMGLRPA